MKAIEPPIDERADTSEIEVREVEDWAEAEADWRRMVRASDHATPFQSWAWIGALHSGGLVPGKPLLLGFSSSTRLVGIAPLTLLGADRGLKRLTLIGGDYCDIIAEPGFEGQVLTALKRWLNDHRSKWDLCDFRGLRSDAVLRSMSGAQGLVVATFEHQSYFAAELTGSWDAYHSQLPSGMRTKLRYFPRKLAKEAGPVSIQEAEERTLDEDLDVLMDLHQRRWTAKGLPGIFNQDAVRNLHREAAKGFLQEGWLRLYVMRAGDKPVAALLAYAKGAEMIYYLGGFDGEFARFGPLKLLIGHAIESAVREGMRAFDFIKGDEPYKMDWRAVPRPTYRVVIATRKPAPLLVLSVLRFHPKLKAWAKKFRRRP